MYQEGRGVPTEDQEANDKKAVALYQQAANKGDATAQNNLGWMYKEGRGVPKDDQEANDKKAVALFGKAAERGDLSA